LATPLVLTALLLAGLAVWLHVESRRENEATAARRSLLLVFALPLPFLFLAWVPIPGGGLIGAILLIATWSAPLLLAFPLETKPTAMTPDPPARLDERTIMFSRARLVPGTERFDEYYREHPEHRAPDDRFRTLPGLMAEDAGMNEPVSFAAAGASFDAVERLAGLVEGEPAGERFDMDPKEAAAFVKGWARKLGAEDCGVARLKDHHVYSVKGRGPRYGETIDRDGDLNHPFAIAFTVEMDYRQLAASPEGPTLMESAQQYLNSGAIAVQLAACLRRLGWRAEAHIDGNYRVVCPLVARDAGLGEIGRMGLLMTPRLGPRVRIAVVTTDMPMAVDARRPFPGVLDFCDICRKCAEVCPPKAIPEGPPVGIEGVARWQVDQEACFTMWCVTGTDCGRCMKVCPYSHPDTLLHNLVRKGLGRSALFRRVALRLDDLLYGRCPGPAPVADWLPDRPPRRNRTAAGGFDELGTRP
jgi:ferredoxin